MATLTASENPVVIPRGGPSKTITINWATGDNSRGRVFEVKGTAEVLFDNGGNATGSTNGSKQRPFTLGETVVFRLRRAVAPNQVIASLTVTTQRAVSLLDVVGAGRAAGNVFGLFQLIYDLKVMPGLDYVDFSFKTAQPTVPLISLTTGAPAAPPGTAVTFAYPLFKGLQTAHEIRVGNPPLLEQDTRHFYKIIAAASRGKEAVVQGTFTTGTQTADFIFERIYVRRDGDPNSRGDFQFNFGAGDAETKDDLGLPWPSFSAEVGDGQTVFVNKTISIPHAPRRLWTCVVGVDDDSYLFAPLCTLGSKPTPGGPWTDHAEQEACEQASVWGEFDTWDNGEFKSGVLQFPFTLATGNFGVAFDVYGRLQVTAVAGAAFKMAMPREAIPQAATVLEPGRIATVATGRERIDLVAPGPEGAVYHKTLSPGAPSLPRGQWTRLGGRFSGSVTAVASGADRVSLFTVGDGGAVFHKTYVDGNPAEEEWENLGGYSSGPVAAVVSAKGRIELFTLGQDGTVSHRSMRTEEHDPAHAHWRSLGGSVSGSLTPLYTRAGGLSIFALGRDGSVRYKRRKGREWRSGAKEWESLGGRFKGCLGATTQDDGTVLLIVFGEDRRVWVNAWAGYPDTSPTDQWEDAGSIDSLFERQIVPVESEPRPAALQATAR